MKNISFFQLDQVEKAYERIFGNAAKFKLFTSKKQKKYLQNYLHLRHIIVHNQGTVDHHFVEATGSRIPVGEGYPLTKKYVMDRIGTIGKVVETIEAAIRAIPKNGKVMK